MIHSFTRLGPPIADERANEDERERFDPIRNKSEQILTTNFRKAVRIYDWLRYGHKKTPEAPKGEEAE